MNVKKKYRQSDLIKVHNYSYDNHEDIARSELCGCFACEKIFFPYEVRDYVLGDDESVSALCPYCEEQAVISDASGYSINKELLEAMRKFYFR